MLDVPFATKDGVVINWIESKALFGTDENHDSYLKDQLRSYRNRFSTGMVIYWFGFISDLSLSTSKGGIFIRDSFPRDEDIILMNPSYDMFNELQEDEKTEHIHTKPINEQVYSCTDTNDALESEISNVTNIIANTKLS